MNLIYNEYINFLNEIVTNKEVLDSLNLKEGIYWLDRQIIKAYDTNGQIYKIARLKVDDELNIAISTVYKNKPFAMESWQETVNRNVEHLNELENESLELIKQSLNKYEGYQPVILTSTGKDSQVVSYLSDKIVTSRKLFNNTTLDCADTYKFVKSMDTVEIVNPQEGFYQWVVKNPSNVPSRFHRTCCSKFKEGSTVEYLDKNEKYMFFMGIRNEESNTRANYQDEIKNEKWGTREWQGILPIRKWTEVDIWLYTLYRSIPINPKYKKGYGRVGCAVACPFYNKSTWVLDKYWYPKMYDRWHNILKKDFIDNKKSSILNCTLKEYHINWNGGVVHDEPSEKVIQEFAEQQNLSINIAKKYFSKNCSECGKKVKKNEIAMYLKLFGRYENVEEDNRKFLCRDCLCKELNIDTKEYKSRVKEFKNQGCELF